MAQRVCILCEQDFQDLEVLYPKLRLIEAGYKVVVAGLGAKEYKGKYGYPVNADADLRTLDAADFDAFVVPGGWAPDFLRRTPHAAELLSQANQAGKLIAAICHGGWLLASADILKGKTMTSFFAIQHDLQNAGASWVDRAVVVDGNLISSRTPDDLPDFMKAILGWLEEHS